MLKIGKTLRPFARRVRFDDRFASILVVQPIVAATLKRTFRQRVRSAGVGGLLTYAGESGRSQVRPKQASIEAPAEHRKGRRADVATGDLRRCPAAQRVLQESSRSTRHCLAVVARR